MSFATTQDVSARLGRELTVAEDEQAEYLLEAATAVVAEAVDQDDVWADALDPVPNIVRVVTTELAVRAMSNPSGASFTQETLGQYSYSSRHETDSVGMALTDVETLLVRRTIVGRLSGSAKIDSMIRDDSELLS